MDQKNQNMEQKLGDTKNEIMNVIDENKQNISNEIATLKSLQEESTKSIKLQQSAESSTLLSAIEKLAERMDKFHSNPPIRPVEQGSRHGGSQ